ncbi:hypothetical protein GGS21DRAFT_544171 [Xylaria nigripes]|nr:hypothetical protein GGS21DRAFT_544171 [Xylaria nigripes]
MAYDYAFVHLKYTIPFAGVLTVILKPLLTRLDLYKIVTVILLAFFAALPWDSYLIRKGIWTFPPDAIVGPRLLGVPAEELFFFIIQTYITALVYTLWNKGVLHSQFLTRREEAPPTICRIRRCGQYFLSAAIVTGAILVGKEGKGTYFGLILIWACPFLLLALTLSGYFFLQLPVACTAMPICLPTLYLWVVDELALSRGTWVIGSGTQLGWNLWGNLVLEEAVFFLISNVMVVSALVAFDRATAVLVTFPEMFPRTSARIPLTLLIRAISMDPARYDMERVRGIREAVSTLRKKSRSFYLASAVFPGRLRIDLVLLYSFCRVADDFVDDSRTEAEAIEWIQKLTLYLDQCYRPMEKHSLPMTDVTSYVENNFPKSVRSTLELLPTSLLPSGPLYELLEGFKMDLAFIRAEFPIHNETDILTYAQRVASTVGELCLHLVFHHNAVRIPEGIRSRLIQAAVTMGHALQYVNIARDIQVDADLGRVYLPTNWLKEEGLTPQDVCSNPRRPEVEVFRQRLLDLAFKEYERSRPVMNLLPNDVRGPLIVAVESYMEIGRVLREKRGVPSATKRGRATVPLFRRLWVAWKNLSIYNNAT